MDDIIARHKAKRMNEVPVAKKAPKKKGKITVIEMKA